MGLFKTKVVDRYVSEWQYEGFATLIRSFGGAADEKRFSIRLPIANHFAEQDQTALTGEPLIHFLFDRIRQDYTYIGESDIELEIIETPQGGFLGQSALIRTEGDRACGTYEFRKSEDGKVFERIRCDLREAENPSKLIATLSHEMAHAIHGRMLEPLEIEPELYELFTDLTAIFFGYGVFLANSRFEFQSHDLGWQAAGAGYLPEADQIHALAVFLKLNDHDPEVTKVHLKPRLAKLLGKALKQVDQNEHEIDKLKSIKMISPLQ